MSFPYDLPLQLQTEPPDAAAREAEERSPPLPTVMLPTFDLPAYSYEVGLGGAVYRLELRRNRSDGHRYLSLHLNDEPLRLGVRLIEGWPVDLGVDPRLPRGLFVPLAGGELAFVEAPS